MWMRLWGVSLALVLVACARMPIPTAQPMPTQNAQSVQPQAYVYYFPVVRLNLPHTEKSVAMLGSCESAQAVGAQNIYTYWVVNPHCGVTWDAMIWGASQVETEADASEYLLEFNEPNEKGQANLTPNEAAPMIRRIEERFQNRKLVSPAPSQNNTRWLDDTRDVYVEMYGEPPRWDVVAIHCYFTWREMMLGCENLVKDYAIKARDWGASELWLTEFAGIPGVSGADAVALESEFVDWLKTTGYAARYYHFVSQWNPQWDDSENQCAACGAYSLTDAIGNLTSHGKMYKSK